MAFGGSGTDQLNVSFISINLNQTAMIVANGHFRSNGGCIAMTVGKCWSVFGNKKRKVDLFAILH